LENTGSPRSGNSYFHIQVENKFFDLDDEESPDRHHTFCPVYRFIAGGKAQCDTIRLKLFKIGAHIRLSVGRVRIAFSESYPYAELFRKIIQRLQQIP
jgi:hypothetical protein